MRNTVRLLTFIYPQQKLSRDGFLGAQRTPGLGPWSGEATTLLIHHKIVFF